jgi:hypothetical protein
MVHREGQLPGAASGEVRSSARNVMGVDGEACERVAARKIRVVVRQRVRGAGPAQRAGERDGARAGGGSSADGSVAAGGDVRSGDGDALVTPRRVVVVVRSKPSALSSAAVEDAAGGQPATEPLAEPAPARKARRVVVVYKNRSRGPSEEGRFHEPPLTKQPAGALDGISQADLRMSGALLVPLAAAYGVATTLPLAGGVLGTGLFAPLLSLLSNKIGAEMLLSPASQRWSSEVVWLVRASDGLAASGVVLYCCTLLTSGAATALAFAAVALAAYACSVRALVLLHRTLPAVEPEPAAAEAVEVGPRYAPLESLRAAVPPSLHALAAVLAALSLAVGAALVLPFTMSRVGVFCTALPLLTRYLGGVALTGSGGAGALLPARGASGTVLSMIGLATGLLNPVVHIAIVLSTGMSVLASAASVVLGALAWLCVLKGLLSATSEGEQRRQQQRQSAAAARAGVALPGLGATLCACAVAALGYHVHAVSGDQQTQQGLIKGAGATAAHAARAEAAAQAAAQAAEQAAAQVAAQVAALATAQAGAQAAAQTAAQAAAQAREIMIRTAAAQDTGLATAMLVFVLCGGALTLAVIASRQRLDTGEPAPMHDDTLEGQRAPSLSLRLRQWLAGAHAEFIAGFRGSDEPAGAGAGAVDDPAEEASWSDLHSTSQEPLDADTDAPEPSIVKTAAPEAPPPSKGSRGSPPTPPRRTASRDWRDSPAQPAMTAIHGATCVDAGEDMQSPPPLLSTPLSTPQAKPLAPAENAPAEEAPTEDAVEMDALSLPLVLTGLKLRAVMRLVLTLAIALGRAALLAVRVGLVSSWRAIAKPRHGAAMGDSTIRDAQGVDDVLSGGGHGGAETDADSSDATDVGGRDNENRCHQSTGDNEQQSAILSGCLVEVEPAEVLSTELDTLSPAPSAAEAKKEPPKTAALTEPGGVTATEGLLEAAAAPPVIVARIVAAAGHGLPPPASPRSARSSLPSPRARGKGEIVDPGNDAETKQSAANSPREHSSASSCSSSSSPPRAPASSAENSDSDDFGTIHLWRGPVARSLDKAVKAASPRASGSPAPVPVPGEGESDDDIGTIHFASPPKSSCSPTRASKLFAEEPAGSGQQQHLRQKEEEEQHQQLQQQRQQHKGQVKDALESVVRIKQIKKVTKVRDPATGKTFAVTTRELSRAVTAPDSAPGHVRKSSRVSTVSETFSQASAADSVATSRVVLDAFADAGRHASGRATFEADESDAASRDDGDDDDESVMSSSDRVILLAFSAHRGSLDTDAEEDTAMEAFLAEQQAALYGKRAVHEQ